jgi:hypothetical protein
MGQSFHPIVIIQAIFIAETGTDWEQRIAPVASAGRWKDWHVVCRALYGEFAH